jgi:hypothetical protein
VKNVPTLETASGQAMMIALSPTRAEALAREGRDAYRAYMKIVETQYRTIYCSVCPQITVFPDGHTEYVMPEWAIKAIAEVDKVRDQMTDTFPWKDYGLEKPK